MRISPASLFGLELPDDKFIVSLQGQGQVTNIRKVELIFC